MFSVFCLRGGCAVLPALLASLLVACGTPQETENLPPVVSAGSDQSVAEGSAVTLAATTSDPEGGTLTLRWTQTSGPTATLEGADSGTLRFTAPAVNADADLQFTLTATDPVGLSASDTVVVRVTDIPRSNRAPIVNAGLDRSVDAGSTVTLSGAASDEDGTIAAHVWQQTSGPAVALRDASTASASFDAPAVEGPTVLAFTLTATDNAGASGSDTVNITVQPVAAPNRAPVADAGSDLDIEEGLAGELLGSGTDEDGTVARFQWRQIAGPDTPLSDAGAARPQFTAPQVSADSELQFELVVTDDKGAASAPDTVRVTVRNVPNANQPPVVSAGEDQSADEGAAVTLTGSASDADGQVVTRAWTQVSGPPAGSLSGAEGNTLRFTAPQVATDATLVFRFTATDDDNASASDTVEVRVRDVPAANQPPTVSAGPDQLVDEGAAVTLDGSASDADGSAATLRWTQLSGDPLTLQGAETAALRFTAPSVGPEGAVFSFRLTASDDDGASASDTVEVRVRDTTAVAAVCAPGQLCVGSARRTITPRDTHIAGVTETRLGGQQATQRFHLGGFGFGPIEAFGPFNEFIANDPAARASHCPGLVAECADEAREHTWVRAFYLAQPGNTPAEIVQTLLITLDAVGAGNLVQQTLTEAIAAETGVPVGHILIGQTHTHAGADLQGLWGGVPQDWVQNVLRSEAVVAAKTAVLNARAAQLTFAAGRDGAFNSYRRPRQTDPDADVDDQLAVLQARDSLGGVLGTLVQYAAHPTAIGTGSGGALGRVPHADYPLGLEDVLEARFGATAIYYNGPIADASASGSAPGSDDYARVRARGACLAQSVLALLDDQSATCGFSELSRTSVRRVNLAPTLALRQETAILPVTNPVFFAGALAGAFNRYYDFLNLPLATIPGIGPMLAGQQTNLPQVAPIARTAVSRITIGGAAEGLEIVTLPGEATNTFGQSVRRLAASPNMMLFGLTHNSFGYIIPEEEYSAINASGDAGFVLPFTGYEEFVSLGPLTAPLLRLQAYNPLFDIGPDDPRNLPPTLTSCAEDPNSRQCLFNQTLFRIDYIQREYANACRANAPAEGQSFCALLDPDTPLYAPCRAEVGLDGLCAVLGKDVDPPPPADADGDDVPDASDRCPESPADAEVDERGCTAAQAAADDDADGVANPDDQCPATPAGVPVDAQGCPQSAGNNASCTLQQNLAGNRSYQVTLRSASGETVSFQVLEPKTIDCATRASGAHPLILHGHGFGGARNTSGFANYRDQGYAVISIDQRGFGDSSGTVRVMDPDFEGRDLVQILDWAEQNLDYLAWRDEGSILKPFVARPADAQSVARGANLLVGAIGSSYGGGYQFLLQNVDAKERLDAMAPDIAWHDLRWSLNPGDVIKTGWDLLLVAGGTAGSYGPGLQNQEPPTQRGLDPYILETLARGAATGEFPREALEWFRYHSPSYWCGLNGQPAMPYAVREHAPFDPNVMITGQLEALPGSNQRTGQPALPVLISQGMKDTLFNFNDAWWNFQCMAARGDDVRLITHQSGHLLPLIQAGGNNDCGGRSRGTATVQWFGEKLRGSEEATALRGTEEAVCLSLADGDAVDIPFTQFLAPRAADSTLPALEARYTDLADVSVAAVPQGVPAALLGLGDAFNQQADQVFPLPPPQVAELFKVRAGSALILAGIAQAEISLRSPQMVNDLACATAVLPTLRTGCDAMVFVGLGVKKAGTQEYVLVDDQVLPVRGLGSHSVSLVGVGERLAAGDTLGLLVYGYHPQYLVTVGRDSTLPVVQLTADLALPLYVTDGEGQPDFDAAVLATIDRATTPPDTDPPATPVTGGYGSGLLGTLARLSAALHHVLVALASLDPVSAADQLQAALATLVEDLTSLVTGGEDSLVALLTNLGENLAGGDPQAAVSEGGSDLGAVIGLDTDPASAAQRSTSAAREVEAVVLTGAQLTGWSAVPAQGVPHPYPSGTGLASQCRSNGGPEAFCNGLGDALADTPLDPEVRSAHNGSFIYPPAYVHGETQPVAGGVPVEQIAAFAYTAEGSWHEIPVQVDERFPYFLANSRSDFGVYSGTDEELSYAWDVERWDPTDDPERQCFSTAPRGTPDPVAGLDDDDELVFMARDAGVRAPPDSQPGTVPAGARSQLVTLADPLNPATPRFVYLYQRSSGSSFAGAPHYVRYARHADADQWIDQGSFQPGDPEQLGSSNRGYGANLTGKVCRYATDGSVIDEVDSEDRFPRDGVTVTTDTYRWTASGRWMVRGVEIRQADGNGYGADVLDRWKGRAFQQSPDSTVSLVGFEDEQVNWEGNSMLLGERCGPVRCIREVWGADSGTNVTKTETFYRDAISYRYHVRVHPIPPDGLYTSWDYNRSAMVPTAAELEAGVPGGRYYTALRPQGVPIDGINDDLGQIDSIAPVGGFCLTSEGPQEAENGRCPLFFDATDPTFNLPLAFANWEQVSAKGNLGSLVYTFEIKGATSLATPAVVPYYRDDACLDDGTGDDPVIRPWPGEASTDARVVAAYTDRNGDGVVSCEEKQGAHAAHGIHYFFTSDVDNGFVMGKPINEIDGLQWQFMVPTAAPVNVGEPYANVSRIPLKAVAVPLSVGPLPTPPGP